MLHIRRINSFVRDGYIQIFQKLQETSEGLSTRMLHDRPYGSALVGLTPIFPWYLTKAAHRKRVNDKRPL